MLLHEAEQLEKKKKTLILDTRGPELGWELEIEENRGCVHTCICVYVCMCVCTCVHVSTALHQCVPRIVLQAFMGEPALCFSRRICQRRAFEHGWWGYGEGCEPALRNHLWAMGFPEEES